MYNQKEHLDHLTEIQRQIEFYFSENTIDREDLMRNVMEVDCGYVTIDLILMFLKLQNLNCSATDVQKVIQNSTYLLLSNDGKRIRRLAAYRLPEEPYMHRWWHPNSSMSTFIEAVQLRKFISAKKSFKNGNFDGVSRKDSAQLELLRQMGSGEIQQIYGNSNLKPFFISSCIHSPLIRFSQELDLRPVQSFAFLLWTVFPRLLLTYPDIIREPSIFQRPDWASHWKLAVKLVEQGLTKINSNAIEVISRLDFPYSEEGCLCIIRGVDAAVALLLAGLVCVNPRIFVVHDNVTATVRIKDVSMTGHGFFLSGVQQTIYRMKTTVSPSPSSSSSSSTTASDKKDSSSSRGGGGGANNNDSRVATPDEVLALHRLRLEVTALPPLCHINWAFYCRELLESMEKVSTTNTVEVSELNNADYYSLPERVLLRVDGVNRDEARVIASALCSSRIIVVHQISSSTISIKDIVQCGPLRSNLGRTTYRVLPPEGLQPPVTGTKIISVGSRAMSEAELKYLRALRWRDRLPALVVAARFRNGAFFHVLKMVANYL